MTQLLHRTVLICAAVAFAAFATPLTAQQTTPDQPPPTQQTPTSVPPAPPPDRQVTPATPPPFPPMPSRAPRHRFVDMGEHHRSPAHHRTTRSTHRAKHAATHSRHHATSRRRGHAHRVAPAMSKKAIRRCHGMSYRQLLRHKDCAALLQRELSAAAHSKHRSGHHKATKRHKTIRHHSTRHTSARHRRR